MHDDDEDELANFYRHFKPPPEAELLAIAQEIGKAGQEVRRIMHERYTNNAHPSVDALFLAYDALLFAEMCCLAGQPMPNQLQTLRGALSQLAWRMGEED
jgi:hypothetical protein